MQNLLQFQYVTGDLVDFLELSMFIDASLSLLLRMT